MKTIIRNSLEKKTSRSSKNISALLNKKFQAYPAVTNLGTLWNLESYALGDSKFIRELSLEQQQELLTKLALGRLSEALNIEKAGMSFTGKMSLLAQTFDEQKLYLCFAKEEASHFSMLEAIVGGRSDLKSDVFIVFLNELIINGTRGPLIFIIQVILEGWGIHHYQILSKDCNDLQSRSFFNNILVDEAGHHGSGLCLFVEEELSDKELSYTIEMMVSFLQMVAVGPAGIIGSMNEVGIDFTKSQQQKFYDDIRAFDETNHKLQLIRGLILKAGAVKILDKLDTYYSFRPAI